uniref:arginine repressor n=1 Tax=Candidatus Enterococcus willemsii TaxID=1857215 RepID=UPI00403FAD90
MRKADRHVLIKQLINNHTIQTQEELLHLLEEQGVTATQATISRDIRDLQIVKTSDGHGHTKFELFQENHSQHNETEKQRLIHVMQDVVTKIDRVQFMTIINTIPDNAPILAAAIDEVAMEEKVCSIAGFDIVVIISRTEDDAKVIENFFRTNV